MSTCSKSNTWFEMEDSSALRVIVLTPYRADKQLFANLYRIEILLPIIKTSLNITLISKNLKIYILRTKTLLKKSRCLSRVIFRAYIYVYSCSFTIFCKKLLINKVYLGYFKNFLLK